MTGFPMVPSPPVWLPATPADWWVQPKWRGWHLAVCPGIPGPRIVSKNGRLDLSDWIGLRELSEWAERLPWPVAGEFVCVEGKTEAAVATARRRLVDGCFHVFDVMIEGVPIEERFGWLEQLRSCPLVRVIDRFEVDTWDDVNRLFRGLTRDPWIEGAVLKRRGSLYQVGVECPPVSPDWIKLKQPVVL
jgi:hypothetical protein